MKTYRTLWPKTTLYHCCLCQRENCARSRKRKTFSQNVLAYNVYWVTDCYWNCVTVLRNKDYYTNAIFWRTSKDALCLLIMYFIRYCWLTGAGTENFSINEQIPRIGLLSVQCKLRAPELLLEQKSGCGCVGHGRGFYVNMSALAANILFGIWEWNESNEMDTWLLFSVTNTQSLS